MNLSGVITALITPFSTNDLDEKGLIHNLHFQIENEVDGILVLGTTGEMATLTAKEQEKIIAIARLETAGKLPLIANVSDNATQRVVEKAKLAQTLKVDALLIAAPYYNKPTQVGIYHHFKAVIESIDLPIIIYNHPGRCGVNIEIDTLAKLAEFPQICAVKEASGSLTQVNAIIEKGIPVLSGDDALTLPMLSIGAQGVFSVVSNLLPNQMKKLMQHAQRGDLLKATAIHQKLFPLFQGVALETNPIPIKTAMNLCNMPAGNCRLPLCAMQKENQTKLQKILEQYTWAELALES